MRWRVWFLAAIVVVLLVAAPEAALAGPGGKIAAAVAKTFWGRVALAALVVLFLPLILYVLVREWLAARRTHRDLRRLRSLQPAFDWLMLKDRVIECFHRVHAAWRKEDMAQASQWMTDWYWQNQQLAHLDRWAEQGLVNRCTVKSVGRIRPLHLACRDSDGLMSGSRVVVAVTAKMEDYLEERATGRVVEGEKGYKDVESVWSFELQGGSWRVANIEEDSLTLVYAQMGNELPESLPQPAARRA
jgi:hypothetical protein